jgi:hypothetical protein
MRRFFRRSMVWFLPVVIIPLGALLFMKYRFLRALEQKSVSAERNWQRNAIEAVAADIDDRFRRDAASALSLSHVQLISVGTLGKHFREHPVPGARRYLAVEFHGHNYTSQLFDANGVEVMTEPHEEVAVKLAIMPWHMAHKMDRVAERVLQTDERDPDHRIILRPVLDASMHVVGVAGVMLDSKIAYKKVTYIAANLFQNRHPSRSMDIRVGRACRAHAARPRLHFPAARVRLQGLARRCARCVREPGGTGGVSVPEQHVVDGRRVRRAPRRDRTRGKLGRAADAARR